MTIMNKTVTNNDKLTPSYIGAMCSNYRRYYTGASQENVATDVGCDSSTVSKFERGVRPNAVIFMWYIKRGLFDWVPIEKWNGWDMGL